MHVQYPTIKTRKGCGYAALIWHEAGNTGTGEHSGILLSQYVLFPFPPFLHVASQSGLFKLHILIIREFPQ